MSDTTTAVQTAEDTLAGMKGAFVESLTRGSKKIAEIVAQHTEPRQTITNPMGFQGEHETATPEILL